MASAPSSERSVRMQEQVASALSFLHTLDISDTKQLQQWLHFAGVDHTSWGETGNSKPFRKLVHEVIEEKSVVLVLRVINTVGYLVRYERTLSMRIEHELSAHTSLNRSRIMRLRLKEFVERADGSLAPRRHPNPSEKYTWEENCVVDVAKRLAREELGILLEDEDLSEKFFRHPRPIEDFWEEFQANLVSVEDMHRSQSYPGLWTVNEIERRVLTLRRKHFERLGYREHGTKNVSRWVRSDGTLYD